MRTSPTPAPSPDETAGAPPSDAEASPAPAAPRRGVGVFRAMFEGSVAGLAVLDPRGRILRVNRSLARMLDAPPSRLFGRSLRRYLRGDPAALEPLRRALEQGRSADVPHDLKLVSRRGGETWVRVKLTARRRGGRAVFSLAMLEDVGDRHRAAEAMARRAALLQLMQNLSSAANRAGSLLEVLRDALEHTCAYTGWPVGHVFVRGDDGALVSSGIWRLTEPERFAGLRAATHGLRVREGEGIVGRVAASGQPAWVEDVHGEPGFMRAHLAAGLGVRGAVAWPIRAEGEVVAVAEFFSTQPERPDPELLELLGNLGTQLGVVVERERMAARLRESEHRFEQILDAVPAGVLVRDRDGAVRYANRAAERLLGPPPHLSAGAAAAGGRLRLAGTGESYPAGRLPMLQALEGRAAAAEDLEVEVDGRRVPLHVEAAPILDEAGRVAYAVAAFVDVSELRTLEGALREHARELERSNRELEEFAYVASHDLQEPLRKIRAFGDRLAEGYGGALGPEGSDYLARMLGAAGRMQRLIQDLLLYSRVSRRPPAPARVELSAVLGEVLGDLEGRLRETGGRVEAGPLPAVRADATQMRQLLQNLVANALKFHRAGVPPVVRVRSEPAEGGTVRVVVEDEGIGFEAGQAERIFLPFQRLHGRAEYEGTGMGLAICRRIAEAAGGTIEARAEPGRGAEFTVTLPGWAGRKEGGR